MGVGSSGGYRSLSCSMMGMIGCVECVESIECVSWSEPLAPDQAKSDTSATGEAIVLRIPLEADTPDWSVTV